MSTIWGMAFDGGQKENKAHMRAVHAYRLRKRIICARGCLLESERKRAAALTRADLEAQYAKSGKEIICSRCGGLI